MDLDHNYSLDVGRTARRREAIVDAGYRHATLEALGQIQVGPGMRVADVGCGTGSMLPWFSAQVSPGGRVIGIDQSAEQMAEARRRVVEAGLSNVTIGAEDVADLDLVFSRFVINHLADPAALVRQMAAMARPGGTVMVIEVDLRTTRTEPRSAAYDRVIELWDASLRLEGKDSACGSRLPEVFRAAGLTTHGISSAQPVAGNESVRHMLEDAVRVAGDRLDQQGLATPAELEALLAASFKDTADEQRDVLLPAIHVCWANSATAVR